MGAVCALPDARVFGTLFRLFGKPIFARYARDTL